MMKNSQIRREVLDLLRGRWLEPVAISFLLMWLASLCSGTVVLLWLVFEPAYYGFNVGLLRFVRSNGEEKLRVESLFSAFDKELYGKVVLTSIVKAIFIFLWSLLLVVPGVIKALSYSMTSYVIADNPEIDYREALNRSEAIMKGHKMDYFLLQLGYFALAVLCVVFTLGIGLLWLKPYYDTVRAKFYEQIKM